MVDVTPIQCEHATRKLSKMPWATVRSGDASQMEAILPSGETPYDTAYAFMLLHEIPDEMKYQVVDNMLRSVKKGGTVVWVEYHGPPYWYNPTRYFMPFIFRWLEPFALRMWESEIESFASEELKSKFTWTKEVLVRLFGSRIGWGACSVAGDSFFITDPWWEPVPGGCGEAQRRISSFVTCFVWCRLFSSSSHLVDA